MSEAPVFHNPETTLTMIGNGTVRAVPPLTRGQQEILESEMPVLTEHVRPGGRWPEGKSYIRLQSDEAKLDWDDEQKGLLTGVLEGLGRVVTWSVVSVPDDARIISGHPGE